MEVRKSKVWRTLNVPLTEKFEEKELLISEPKEFKLPDNVRFNDFDPTAIQDFIKTHNRTLSDNINLFPSVLLKNLSGSCYTTIMKGNEIISFALATIIPIRTDIEYNMKFEFGDWKHLSSQKTLLYGYTNYLCAHKDHRDAEKGINAIKATLNYGIPRGVMCGYFISPSARTSNYVTLRNWLRPLDFKMCRKAGFSFLNLRKDKDKSEIRNELYYKIKIDQKYGVIEATSKHLKNFLQLSKNCTFCLAPNGAFWDRFIEIFKTVVVTENGKVVAIGSFLITETLMTKTETTIKIANMVFCIGDPVILKALILEASKSAHIAMGYDIGICKEAVLADLRCFFSGKMYLELYNSSVIHNIEDICVPIF